MRSAAQRSAAQERSHPSRIVHPDRVGRRLIGVFADLWCGATPPAARHWKGLEIVVAPTPDYWLFTVLDDSDLPNARRKLRAPLQQPGVASDFFTPTSPLQHRSSRTFVEKQVYLIDIYTFNIQQAIVA
ncbi:MAG: hypothetical protein IPM40_13865 [Gammaproteobacteria bacterium]|nr:hypothetical protein [Gammaproteobacteria bacterium]